MSKRPKQSTRAGGPAVGTADSDFGEAVRVFHDASIAVWSDPVVWEDEALSSETRLLAWPQPDDRGTRVQRFFAQRFNEEVLTVVQLMTVRAAPAQPLDARDPRLQLVLRVVMRASQRGLAAVASEFAGTRLTGHGRWLKTIKEQGNHPPAEPGAFKL